MKDMEELTLLRMSLELEQLGEQLQQDRDQNCQAANEIKDVLAGTQLA